MRPDTSTTSAHREGLAGLIFAAPRIDHADAERKRK
jgi:hypothetical protein